MNSNLMIIITKLHPLLLVNLLLVIIKFLFIYEGPYNPNLDIGLPGRTCCLDPGWTAALQAPQEMSVTVS